MKKIILSLLTIGVVGGGATYATFAYFNSVQKVEANTISTGSMQFQGVIQDENGSSGGNSGKFSFNNLAPGEYFVRCLWIKNNGTVAGRYKIYATEESGDNSLGNMLTISATLNPTGGVCADNPNPFTGSVKYGPDDLSKSEWQNVGVRNAFLSADTTPFKIESGEYAMPGNYYSLFEIDVKLDNAATQQNSSYTVNVALYGMQDAGSLSGSGW